MSYRESESYLAIPTGEMIKELINNNGYNEKEVSDALHINQYDFYDLLEGDLPLTDEMAESLGDFFGCSQLYLRIGNKIIGKIFRKSIRKMRFLSRNMHSKRSFLKIERCLGNI